MGGVGRRILFNLRNALFTKLQELPVAFFNQNKRRRPDLAHQQRHR